MPLGRTPDRLADRTAGIAPFAATVREAQPSDGSHGEGAMGFTTGPPDHRWLQIYSPLWFLL